MYLKFLNIMSLNTKSLPAGYTELEYIECDARGIGGIAYLIVDYYLNSNSVIDTIFSGVAMNNNYEVLYGASGNSGNNEAYSSGNLGNGVFLVRNNGTQITFDTSSYSTGVKIHLYQNTNDPLEYNFELMDTGNIQTIRSTVAPYATSKLYLFTLQRAYTIAWCNKFKLYSFTIREQGVKVLDLVPCIRDTDGMVAMYDRVNHIFYEKQGNGNFIAGPVI